MKKLSNVSLLIEDDRYTLLRHLAHHLPTKNAAVLLTRGYLGVVSLSVMAGATYALFAVVTQSPWSLFALTAASLGASFYDQRLRQQEMKKHYLMLQPTNPATGQPIKFNGTLVESAICNLEGNIVSDYKLRPLINLDIGEDGLVLFNERPIVLAQGAGFQTLQGEPLRQSPGGTFYQQDQVHRLATPLLAEES